MMLLKDEGERGAINRIWKIIGVREPYDDCVYMKSGDFYRLYTTDFMSENVHFIKEWNPKKVGKFFAAINLSDIAAMGGTAEIFMAAMAFSKNVETEYVDSLILGMIDLLKRFNVSYKGGDFKESSIISMAGFVVGKVEEHRILKRNALHLGDGVFLTGELGKQAAGYVLWKNGYEEGVDYILDVWPRLEEGRKISQHGNACMDLSDGIMSATRFLSNENYGIRVDFDELPIHKLAYEVSEEFNVPLEILASMFGGEYELVYTAPTHILGKEIGMVVEKHSAGLWKGNKRVEGEGYAHFGKTLEKIRG